MDYRTGIRVTRALVKGDAAFLAAVDASPDFDPGALLTFARAQKLLDWFTPLATSQRARSRLPAHIVTDLEEHRATQSVRKHGLLELSQEIQAGFGAKGVPCLFLKGFYFGERFYGDIHRRHQGDVDVLVRPTDVEAALDVLATLGCDTATERVALRMRQLRSPAPGLPPQTILLRSKDRLKVDLHWRTKSRWFTGVDESRYWPDRRTFSVRGREFETLSDEHTLVLLLVSIAADLRRGASRAKHFLDLYLMLRAFGPVLDWERFFARRERDRLLKSAVNVLGAFLTLWDCAEEFPGLAGAVARRRRQLEFRGAEEVLALVTGPPRSRANLLWYQRLGSRSQLEYWRWCLARDLPHTLRRGLPALRRVPDR